MTPDGNDGPAGPDDHVRRVCQRRAALLGELLDGPRAKPALVDRLGVSRSTVDRALKALLAHGLVRRDGGEFVATAAGRLGYEAAERYRNTTTDVTRAAPLLEHLPADATLDAAFLSGATVHRATNGAGRQALRAALSTVEGADTVYACSRAVTDTSAPTAAYRLVVDAGATLEVVYDATVAEYVRAEHAAGRREMVATGRYRAFEAASLPFGLFVADPAGETAVAVAVYDAETTLVGVITNDTDAAAAWAESAYRRHRERATEITDEFASS